MKIENNRNRQCVYIHTYIFPFYSVILKTTRKKKIAPTINDLLQNVDNRNKIFGRKVINGQKKKKQKKKSSAFKSTFTVKPRSARNL